MLSAVFKGLYRGHGIYWHGARGYGDETNAKCDTIAECRERIDCLIKTQEQDAGRAFAIAELKGIRDGDNARIEYRGSVVFQGTMRDARRRIFDIEDRLRADIVWAP